MAKSTLELLGHRPEEYLLDDYLVLDFETDTSHGDFGNPIHPDNGLLLACWKWRDGDIRSVWAGEYGQQDLVSAIERARFIVAHNGKYEAGWLRRCGVDLTKLFLFDTKIAEYLLANGKRMDTSLGAAARRRGLPPKDPVVDALIRAGINPTRIPKRWLEQRCTLDVETTEQLFLDQRRALRDSARLAVQFTRCNLTPCLADIEPAGLCLDADRVTEVVVQYRSKSADLGEQLAVASGGINTASRKQLAEYIYDTLGFAEAKDRRGNPKRTPSGQRATDAKALSALRPETDEQRLFLKLHREHAKVGSALSKSLEFYDGICKHANGIFYGQLNQCVTATGRLSSTGIPTEWGSVQFQNQDRGFKRLFRARQRGWLIGEADGAQLEFRVAADLGRDRQAIADIEDSDFDAHIVSAAAMAGREYVDLLAEYRSGSERAKQLRQAAKPETFKPLYGGTKGTPAQERWYTEFKRRYAGIAKAQENWVYEVLASKRLVTDWGVIFEWPQAKMSASGYVNVTSQVYNYPVQAFATAEIIPIAVTCFWRRVSDEGLEQYIRCVNTIHDSVVCEVHPDHTGAFTRIAKTAFTADVYAYLREFYHKEMIVPLGVSVKIAEHWGEGKELAWDIYANGREVDRTK